MVSPMDSCRYDEESVGAGRRQTVRTLLASIVAGIVIVMLIPLLVLVSIFNTQAGFSQEVARIAFDGEPIPTDIDAEFPKLWKK